MTVSAAVWKMLQTSIDGRVVLPDAPDYDLARKPGMVRFHNVRPAAVVRCRSAPDVAATIAFARQHSLPSAVRSGGHSVAGHSSTDGVVIDVTPIDTVSVDAGVATVGAGVRLGALHDALELHGLTVPAGSSHSVGIAGLTLGGGLGILGRAHGLTCDHLLSAEVVLADGRVVECDMNEHEDLFWGLRGAGCGNFGVVTSFRFATVPAPTVSIFHLLWPITHAAELIRTWQRWAPSGPERLDATLRLSATGDGERAPLVDLFGAYAGSDADAAEVLDQLVARAGAEPASSSLRQVSYPDAKRYLDEVRPADEWGDEAPPPPPPGTGLLYVKSEFFRRFLPGHTIAALVDHVSHGLLPDQSCEVAFTPWGGAYNRVPADATAFVHRDELFMVVHLLTLDPDTTGHRSVNDWLDRSWTLVHPWGSGGVYPNFPDPELRNWARAYYGQNHDRLLRIKAKYDPDGFFRLPHELSSSGWSQR